MARRFHLRAREIRELLLRIDERLRSGLEAVVGDELNSVEAYESDDVTLYLFNERPLLFKSQNQPRPLLSFEELVNAMPRIIVDMGAVPKICNGADVMAPGVRGIQGSFKSKELVAIADERFLKTVAVAEAIFASEEVGGMKSGRIARNLHYVGDRVWKTAKSFEKPRKSQ